MNKLSIYTFAALAGFSLMACDGYKEPNPMPQTNPQQPIFQVSDVTVDNELSSSVYNLINMTETQENIQLAKVTCSALDEGYTFGALAYISADGFATSYEVPVSSQKLDAEDVWELYITPANLSNVYHDNISWSNDQAELSLRYNLTTIYNSGNGTQVAYVGSMDNIYGPYTLNIIPLEADTHFYYLYTPGNSNGWNQEASQPLYSESETGPFTGFAILDGEFKFTDQPNWDGTNYGQGEQEGILSTDGSAGNLMVSEAGLYYCNVNVIDLNYSTTFIYTIGLIGDATPNGWDASSALTSDDYLIWTGEVYLTPGEYKFRANDDWAVNLGGDPNSLTPDGANIVFSGTEGTYTVTLNLNELPYSCTLTKK